MGVESSQPTGDLVLFVCPHGVGKSRMAAALFQTAAPAGWQATSAAGETPGTQLSPHAVRLLADTAAQAMLEHGPGRQVADVPNPAMVVAIDCEPPGVTNALRWSLTHQDPTPQMRQEIDHLVAGLLHNLADQLNGASSPTGEGRSRTARSADGSR